MIKVLRKSCRILFTTLFAILVPALLVSVFAPPGLSRESELTKVLAVQREIETAIKSIIGSQLADGEYFVYAKVKLKPEAAAATDSQSDKLNELVNLPFSPLKVEKEVLQDMFRRNRGESPEVAELDVTIVFDVRVPKEKVELLSGVINDRFGFNGQERRLDVKSLQLVTEPVKTAEKFVLEKTKFDSEKALLELEQARSKFDLAKREAELEAAKKALQERKEEKPPEKPAEPVVVTKTNEAPKGVLDYLQGFQILLMAVIGGLFAVVLIFLAASSLQKGLRPMADAVNRIGEGFGKMAPASAGAAVAAAPVGNISASVAGVGAGGVSAGGHHEMGAIAGNMRGEVLAEDKGLEEFLAQISEKLKVLMDQKNFSFYRHFLDMVESDSYRKMAAAILLTIDEKSARTLLSNLSSEHIDRLKEYLTRPGAMLEARSVSKVALQEFYGRIAAEEFSGSPLYKLTNLNWFTQMTTANMTEFVLSLDSTLRSAFLVCLTPARVNAMIAGMKDKTKREEILKSLKAMDVVTEAQIAAAIEKIGKLAPAKAGDIESRPMVNTAKYIAQVAEQLSSEDQAVLLGDIEQNRDLSKKIRDHIIPFNTVAILPREMLNEIFSARSDIQIAQIIFDAPTEIRSKVMGVLPEIRRENVKSELQVLDDNKLYAKRNRKMSAELQKEITRYLLEMYREGLIELDEKALNGLSSDAATESENTISSGKNVA